MCVCFLSLHMNETLLSFLTDSWSPADASHPCGQREKVTASPPMDNTKEKAAESVGAADQSNSGSSGSERLGGTGTASGRRFVLVLQGELSSGVTRVGSSLAGGRRQSEGEGCSSAGVENQTSGC